MLSKSSPERGGGSPLGLTEGQFRIEVVLLGARNCPSTTLRWSPSPFRGGILGRHPVRAGISSVPMLLETPPYFSA